MYHYCMNFTSVPQGGLRKYCIDSQNWWWVIIAPASSLWALSPLSSSSSGPASVPLHVQGEVIRPRELSATQVALERLLTCNNKCWCQTWDRGGEMLTPTCMFPVVPGQLIRPGKLPRAALPRALIRLLPSVGPGKPQSYMCTVDITLFFVKN